MYNEKVELLLEKKADIAGLPTELEPVRPIYRFTFGGIRGFQVGDLAGRQDAIRLRLFDEADRECFILLTNFEKVTQSEINGLIATLRFEE